MESFDNRFTSQVDFNIKLGRVLRKQSVNSDNNSPRSNDQSAHAIHRPTHNYSTYVETETAGLEIYPIL